MPPLRTMTAPKPIKTERSHEENQERAYIAASRRSDRSLEARLESARRASEIHKRRTGRSLRVTEEDVVNEEMYEEEDDDLPMAYRRMTMHLHTQDPEFNRRLQSYLAAQLGTRRQLNHVLGNQWQNDMQSQGPGFGSPFGSNPMGQMGAMGWQNSSSLPPQMFNRSPSNAMFRPGPYPMANQMMNHGRSMSIANPQDLSSLQQQPQRMPSHSQSASNSPVIVKKEQMVSTPLSAYPQTPQSQSTPHQHNTSPTGSSQSHTGQHMRHYSFPGHMSDLQQQQQQQSTAVSNPYDPLTLSLPLESQQLLSGNPYFNVATDPSFALMMPNVNSIGGNAMQSSYSYNPNGKPKPNTTNSNASTIKPEPITLDTSGGLNQTLLGGNGNSGYDSTSASMFTMPSTTYAPNDPTFNFYSDPFGAPSSTGLPSGEMTPNEVADHFFDFATFDDGSNMFGAETSTTAPAPA